MQKTHRVISAIKRIEELGLTFDEYERLISELEDMKGEYKDPELDNIE